jgi:hypothetical protein
MLEKSRGTIADTFAEFLLKETLVIAEKRVRY